MYFYSEVPCAVNTTSGECCRFPFKYKDVSYQDCTKADHHRPWCSLDPVFKGRWGDCGRCDLLFSLKNLKIPPSLGFWYASPMSQGRGWERGRQAGYNGLFFSTLQPYSPFSLLLITVWIAVSDVLVIRWLCAGITE